MFGPARRVTLLNMHASGRIQLVFLAGTWITGLASQAFCQGTLVRQTPQSATTDSSGHLKKGDAASANDTTAHGLVVLADGSAPMELVEIYGGCGGIQKLIAIADSKGRISFNPSVLTGDATKAKACAVHASLDGYRSETKPLTDTNLKSGGKLGKIVLQPLSSSADGLISRADGEANKAQRTMYEKALDEAAKQDWANAIASLEKATSAYPGYSSAWLSAATCGRYARIATRCVRRSSRRSYRSHAGTNRSEIPRWPTASSTASSQRTSHRDAWRFHVQELRKGECITAYMVCALTLGSLLSGLSVVRTIIRKQSSKSAKPCRLLSTDDRASRHVHLVSIR